MLGLHCCTGFSLAASSRGRQLSARGVPASHCSGFSCCTGQAQGRAGFNHCGIWAQQSQFLGSRAQAQSLWGTGLAALQHVGSSRTRDQNCVSCTDRQIIHLWATREAPLLLKALHELLFISKPLCACISLNQHFLDIHLKSNTPESPHIRTKPLSSQRDGAIKTGVLHTDG